MYSKGIIPNCKVIALINRKGDVGKNTTAEGKSIFAYDKGGKVAATYEQFAKEVAEIGEKQRKQNRADCVR